MLRIVLAITCGCGRFGFDATGIGSDALAHRDGTTDAVSGIAAALPCNTPMLISTVPAVTAPMLAAARTNTGAIAAWVDDTGKVIGGGFVTSMSQLQPLPTPILLSTPVSAAVSVARSPTGVLVAGGSLTNGASDASQLVATDAALTSIAPLANAPVRVRDPHSMLASGATFFMAGDGFIVQNQVTFGLLDPSGTPTTTRGRAVDSAINASSFDLEDSWGVAVITPPGTFCVIARTARDILTQGSYMMDAGDCTRIVGAHIVGRADFVLAWQSFSTTRTMIEVPQLGAGLTMTFAAAMPLANATSPHLVATSFDYWLVYAIGGTVTASPLAPDGTVGPAIALGASAIAFDVVELGDDAIVMWLEGGGSVSLNAARVCH